MLVDVVVVVGAGCVEIPSLLEAAQGLYVGGILAAGMVLVPKNDGGKARPECCGGTTCGSIGRFRRLLLFGSSDIWTICWICSSVIFCMTAAAMGLFPACATAISRKMFGLLSSICCTAVRMLGFSSNICRAAARSWGEGIPLLPIPPPPAPMNMDCIILLLLLLPRFVSLLAALPAAAAAAAQGLLWMLLLTPAPVPAAPAPPLIIMAWNGLVVGADVKGFVLLLLPARRLLWWLPHGLGMAVPAAPARLFKLLVVVVDDDVLLLLLFDDDDDGGCCREEARLSSNGFCIICSYMFWRAAIPPGMFSMLANCKSWERSCMARACGLVAAWSI